MFECQMLICVVFCIYSQSTIGESGNIWGIYREYVSFCPQRNLNPAVFPRPSAVLGMMMPAEWQRVDGSSSDDSIKHGWLGTPAWKIGIVGTFHRSQCVFCHVWHRRVRRSWQEWWCNGDFSWDRMGYWWWNPSRQSHPPNIQTPSMVSRGGVIFLLNPWLLRGVEHERGKGFISNNRGFRRFQASKSAVFRPAPHWGKSW